MWGSFLTCVLGITLKTKIILSFTDFQESGSPNSPLKDQNSFVLFWGHDICFHITEFIR